MKSTKNLIDIINSISTRCIENEDKVRLYLNSNTPITFYNWECPPRCIKIQADGKEYASFDIDLSKIARSVPEDMFTEIPRVLTNKADEIKILRYLTSLGIRYRFVKLIADTNTQFIYPLSEKYDGKSKINRKFNEFKTLITKQLEDYPVETQVVPFWYLLQKNRLQNTYTKYFTYAYNKISKKYKQEILPKEYIALQIQRTKEHIGIREDSWAREVALRTIASYGAEGMVLGKLAKSKDFTNCIWLNIEEVSDRAIAITNFLRKINNLDTIPMIFPNVYQLIRRNSSYAL